MYLPIEIFVKQIVCLKHEHQNAWQAKMLVKHTCGHTFRTLRLEHALRVILLTFDIKLQVQVLVFSCR